MNPLFALLVLQTPFVAKDAGLTWNFPGTIKAAAGRYDLIGKNLRGEVHWFVAKSGRFEAEALYKSDTQRTKESDQTKSFSHQRSDVTFAGGPAIRSDQLYLWNDAAVSSRCIYASQGNRAWVIRLWWPRAEEKTSAVADAVLKSFRRFP